MTNPLEPIEPENPPSTDDPILLYSNQYGGYGFTGAYPEPEYKRLRRVDFYPTATWIVDWSMGPDRDNWIASSERLEMAFERFNVPVDANGYTCIDWEEEPYPVEGPKIEQCISEGSRFTAESAAFRYVQCIRRVQAIRPFTKVGAYGIPVVWNWDWDPRQSVDSPLYAVCDALDWFSPVMYYRHDQQAKAQKKNLARFISWAREYWPEKPVIPHVAATNFKTGVTMGVQEFSERQIEPLEQVGAHGCIYWNEAYKRRDEILYPAIGSHVEPYLDAIDEWGKP